MEQISSQFQSTHLLQQEFIWSETVLQELLRTKNRPRPELLEITPTECRNKVQQATVQVFRKNNQKLK